MRLLSSDEERCPGNFVGMEGFKIASIDK